MDVDSKPQRYFNSIINMVKFGEILKHLIQMIIRVANRSDMPSVLSLIKELARFENDADAVEVKVENLVNDGFDNQPAFQVYVAEVDEIIVGIALFYQRYSTWKGKSLHLEDLIVEEQSRGKGIGKALYSEVLKYAHEKKYKRVSWEVLDWNKPAIDFYEKSGAKILEGWKVVQMDEISLDYFMQNVERND